MAMTVIDPHPDPVQQLALLALLLLGPLGYAVVARWRTAVVLVVLGAGACAWLRLPLSLEPLGWVESHGTPADRRAWALGVAVELGLLVWAVGWAALAFSRQDARAAT